MHYDNLLSFALRSYWITRRQTFKQPVLNL